MRRRLSWLLTATALILGLTPACTVDEGAPTNAVVAPLNTIDGGDGSGKLPNAANCKTAADCESNDCFIGGQQSFCTVSCTTDNQTTTCVAPFTGTCNKQGFCKRT